MSAPLAIATMTVRQVLGLRRLLGLGAMALAPAGIYFLSSGSPLEVFIGIGIGLYFSIVVPVTTLILASSALGDERRDKTLSFIALRPLSRFVLAASKLGGAALTAAAVTALGAAGLGIVFGIRSGSWEYLGAMVLAGALSTLAYAAIFLPLGYLTERATIIGLFYVFIWESAIAGTLPGLATTSPWRVGYSAFAALIPADAVEQIPSFALGDMVPGAWGALFKVVVFLVLSLAVTGAILRYRDLT